MFFKSILQVITVAAVAFTGVHAVPIESESEIVARNATSIAEPSAALADGHLFVCANAIFAQPCNNFEFTINQCINFSSPYDNSISSVGPDSGFVCIVYKLVLRFSVIFCTRIRDLTNMFGEQG
ncbi:hypothetical protein CVT25_013597 [Psilocybe cyanescens]|uniref:Uncharacterized protein n=1 Tax=Psilocybe cyanescens TaxID=93625 RepID=A0A409WT04_PSICY|nr:hypothetical protein CVT25_013597 [Psilocybe cyanescens]